MRVGKRGRVEGGRAVCCVHEGTERRKKEKAEGGMERENASRGVQEGKGKTLSARNEEKLRGGVRVGEHGSMVGGAEGQRRAQCAIQIHPEIITD